MSWSVITMGKRTAVVNKVNANPHIPDPLKVAVETLLDFFPEDSMALIETNGYLDTVSTSPWGPQGKASLIIKIFPEAT